MNPNPLVSILLSVYNGERYIVESIESILNQTYINFELIIINDGSTDNTLSVIRSFNDSRIVLINQENLGLVRSLNKGLDIAKGEFLARADADDICHPERIAKQVDFLLENTSIDVCGTWMSAFDETNNTIWKAPLRNDEIKARALFECPIFHPTILVRRRLYKNRAHYFYDSNYTHAEDYELWTRLLSSNYLFSVIPLPLYRYRLHPSQIGKTHGAAQLARKQEIIRAVISNLVRKDVPLNMVLHSYLLVPKKLDPFDLQKLLEWCQTMIISNRDDLCQKALRNEIGQRLYAVLRLNSRLRLYYRLATSYPWVLKLLSHQQKIKLILRSLVP